jgi:glutaryl-CoA dehydrogenase (non-decarboxylating)
MDFALSEEHKMVQEMVRDFAQNEIAPYIKEWDEQGSYDRKVLDKMGELGILSGPVPEEYGGSGMDYISLAVMCEELERVDTAFRVVLSVHIGLNSLTLLQWANEEQKQRWLTPQAKGEKIATFGLTEPNAGSDAAALETTAVRDGDSYILSGEKMWISLADVADNFLIFAKTDPAAKHRGISCFVVERGTPGFTTFSLHGKMGIRAGNTGGMSLQDVRVPRENMIGEEGEGFKIAMSAIDGGRYTVAAGAVGLTQACLDASIKYAHERSTFGKPIGEHQLVQQMIANMVSGVEAGRLLTYRAGWLKNQGIRNTRETSLAKWYACDASMQAALDAVQIHGANGYSNEFPVERYMRNAKGAVIYEGTAQIHTIMQAEYALGLRKDRPIRMPVPKAQGH